MKSVNNYMLPPIEVYNKLLSGKLKSFPNDFLDKEICKELLRYLLLDKLKLTKNEILKQNFISLLKENKLYTLLKKFDGRYEMINYCFPEFNIKPWELTKVKNSFWDNDENRLDALLWMAKKENINLDDLCDVRKNITARKVYSYFGNRIISNSSDEDASLFELLNLYYKGKYKEWQVVSKVGKWTDKKAIDAIKWLIEDVYHWDREDVCQNICVKVFIDNNLDSMLRHACRHSPLIALQMAYPEENYTKDDIKCIIDEII